MVPGFTPELCLSVSTENCSGLERLNAQKMMMVAGTSSHMRMLGLNLIIPENSSWSPAIQTGQIFYVCAKVSNIQAYRVVMC
jgi:hypothetical protein